MRLRTAMIYDIALLCFGIGRAGRRRWPHSPVPLPLTASGRSLFLKKGAPLGNFFVPHYVIFPTFGSL